MGLEIEYIAGQTPLDEDEKEGILIKTISSRGDLDEFEQYNIENAVQWTLSSKFNLDKILEEKFIMEVHKRMFGEVWSWAGEFRKSNKNIGVDKFQISIELKKLLDDCNFWIDNKTFEPEEISIRFKHRLVSIHLFPNGNGRHSRLCADILISHGFGQPVFTWGSRNIARAGDARLEYLQALHVGDNGEIDMLIKFARS
ncbi:MAG: mobile mystery protein B [Candidatus Marinimicrobia bacterium]|jgi:Fic-DOC domain mobile mystery protein B|nr:mobile mystery protein B [Candidatus Neomarinimicrobiota bacterium]MBT4852833.1 mobile mystery protein B [Candidatus Neomarinimicrobiota bacterium]